MRLPDVWGKGEALFAFSGIDGRTDCLHPLIGATSAEGRGIDFYTNTPASLRVRLLSGESPEFRDEVVAGDVISTLLLTKTAKLRLRYAFLDKDTLLGEVETIESTDPIGVGVDMSVEGAKTKTNEYGIVIRAGSETFTLAGQAEGLKVTPSGLQAHLSAGKSLTFIISLNHTEKTVPLCQRRAAGRKAGCELEISEVFAQRLSFFSELPTPLVDDPLLERAYYKCASVQKVNCITAQGLIPFDWTTPDRWPHRWMWIWDSAFHAIGLRHFAPEWGRNAIKAVLSRQHPDGFIPHTITVDASKDSDISQPPILSWAAWKVYQSVGDRVFIEYCYPRLKSMILWDCEQLDKDGSGLCEWENGFASGMDNSPRFDGPVGDAVDLNAFLANDMLYLKRMAKILSMDKDASMWARMREDLARKINEHLWDEEVSFYFDRDPDGDMVKIKTVAGFTPLFAGICTKERASALVEHLSRSEEFWRPFPVASVSADEQTFCDDMWRGPVWINYNYLIIEGLRRYGYHDLARELADVTLREIARWYAEDGVIYEFYDSEGRVSPAQLHRKGQAGTTVGCWKIGSVIRDYHWTGALFVDIIQKLRGFKDSRNSGYKGKGDG